MFVYTFSVRYESEQRYPATIQYSLYTNTTVYKNNNILYYTWKKSSEILKHHKMRRRLGFRRGIGLFICFITIVQLYLFVTHEDKNPSQLNYFIDERALDEGKFLVDTPNCKIMDFSPWDNLILRFVQSVSKKVDCNARHRNWTYSKDNELLLNQTAIIESGFSLNSVSCCYKTINRVEQSLDSYDMAADNTVKFSVHCEPLTSIATIISAEFIRVLCTCNSWPSLYELVYRSFHAFTPISSNVKRKNQVSSTSHLERKPPNVLILGIDSMSRLHFHRNMNKTKLTLERMGAVEILGYTKVGENTFPNNVAFLSGYDAKDLVKVCHYSNEFEQDSCPYIWRRFSDANYITATVEDAPFLTGFNYLKAGFVNKPTDYYFRPFMLGVHMLSSRSDYYTAECIGTKSAEEAMMDYIGNLLRMSYSGAPVFIHSWMTNLAHQNMNNARFADETFETFLKNYDFSNTIFFFLSDHGYRYGAIRETLPGWYEDKLPILWIYIGNDIQKQYPNWQLALQENSIRLTSPFDLYYTMNDVLSTFSNTTSFPDGKTQDNVPVPRVYGQSLFQSVPLSRTCKQAGITINFCACIPPRKLNLDDPYLQSAAKAAVNYLNEVLPPTCSKLEFSAVTAGAIMKNEDSSTFVVTFITVPGEFLFEANVEYDEKTGNYSISTDLLRMNKIQRDVSCVNTSLLERYCYCL